MERRAFLESLSAPVFVACAVCMGACSKSSDGTTTGTTQPPPTLPATGFTIDLATQITTVGSSVAVNGVLVARLSSGNTPSNFVAVQHACTHQGTLINFVASSNSFLCPNHGAQFNTSGANTGGQSTSPLKVYNIAINGNTMTVTG